MLQYKNTIWQIDFITQATLLILLVLVLLSLSK